MSELARKIEAWKGCDPKVMTGMSSAAIHYALCDAKHDILKLSSDFDRVTSERDAALEALSIANEKIDKAWNRTQAIDHKGFIPGALDAWKRPIPQHLPYDFSGNPGASATQYCNGWNECGGYWSAHADELQQRLTAADERADVLEGLVGEVMDAVGREPLNFDAVMRLRARMRAALKPAEGGGDEAI